MKKITIVLLALLSLKANISYSQNLSEDFEGGVFPPTNWELITGAGDWDESNAEADHTSGAGSYARYACYDINGTSPASLIAPTVVVTNGDQTFSFWYNYYLISGTWGETAELYVDVSSDGGTTWTSGTTNYISGNHGLGWLQVSIDLGNYEGQNFIGSNATIRFRGISDYGSYDIGIDDVSGPAIYVPACPKPTAIAAGNITQNSADISWTTGGASNWMIAVVPSGQLPGAGSGISTNPYSATGLASGTSYDVYVKDSCGVGDVSDWAGPYTFSTYTPGQNCDLPIVVSSLPYMHTGQNTSTYLDDYSTSPCSDNYISGDEVVYTYTAPATGSINIDVTNITDTYAGVLVTDDCPDVAVNCIGQATNGSTTGDLNVVANVSSGTTYYIVISTWTSPQNTGYDLTITDISCSAPASISVTNIQANTADISWTAGSSLNWDVAVVPTGNSMSGYESVTSTTHTVTGLSASTGYDVYVRDSCGVGDVSSWTGPMSFSTPCDAVVPPYTQDFSTVMPVCWNEADAGNPSTGPSSLGSGGWTEDGYANNGSTGAVKINLWNTGDNDWLLTPLFDFTSGGPYQLDFDLAFMDYSSSTTSSNIGSDDSLKLLVSSDGGTTWSLIYAWDNSYAPVAGGEHFIFNLSAYSGNTVQFAFWATEGTIDDTEDVDISIDNFVIDLLPGCPSPTGLSVSNITQTGANASWTTGGASNWQIAVVSAGDQPGVGTATSSNPYIISGLSPSTTYDVYVKDSCGTGDVSGWFGPVSFTTECSVFSVPFRETFNSASTSQNCWTVVDNNNDGDMWNMDYTSAPYEGDESAMIYTDFNSGDNDDYLISPKLTLTGNEQLRFYTRAQSSGEPNEFKVMLSATDTDPTSFNTEIMSLTNVSVTTYEEHIVDISAYSGNVYLAFVVPTESSIDGWRLYIDDVNVEFIPSSCPPPFNVSVTNIAASTADISWTTGGAANWNVAVVESGLQINNAVSVTSASHTPTSLLPNTSYDVYVQDSCGVGDVSFWNGPFTFTTEALCPAVSNVQVSGVTETTANISWTAGGNGSLWNIAIVEMGSTLSGSTPVSQNSYSATGLSGSVQYDVYVQEDCGGGETSNWTGPISFSTPCVAITPEYLQQFESFLPYCWSEASGGNPSSGVGTVGSSNWMSGGYANFGSSGGAVINVSASGNSSWLLSPEFDLSGSTPYQLDIDLALMEAGSATSSAQLGSDDQVQILLTTDGGTTWNNLATFDNSSVLLRGGEHFIYDLTAYSGNVSVQFAIWASDGIVDDNANVDVSIDNFKIWEIQSCPQPQNIVVSNITSSSARIAWTTGGASSWKFEIVPSGNEPTGNGLSVSNNPMTVTSLMANTFYDVYVQDDCGGGDLSYWTGPVSFGTTCGTGSVDGDNSANPIQVSVNSYINMKNTASCYTDAYSANASPDVWYLLILNDCASSLDVSLCNSDFDTKIHVLDINENLLFTDDNGCGGVQSALTAVPVNGGDSVYIVVEGNGMAQGTYELQINQNLFTSPNAGTGGAKDICVTSTYLDLFNEIGGTPQTSGYWSDLSNSGAMDNGIFDASVAGIGTYTFRYSVASGQCNYIASSLVVVDVQDCVGIDERFNDRISLYPNPAKNQLTVSIDGLVTDEVLKIVAVDGRLLQLHKLRSTSTTIDVSMLSSGIYFIEIGGVTNKIVIDR